MAKRNATLWRVIRADGVVLARGKRFLEASAIATELHRNNLGTEYKVVKDKANLVKIRTTP